VDFAPLSGPDARIPQLYTIDLTTGAATHAGRIGDGTVSAEAIVGLAAPVGQVIPEPTTLALLGMGLAGAGMGAVRGRRRAGTAAQA
jgi:hypothetical protein